MGWSWARPAGRGWRGWVGLELYAAETSKRKRGFLNRDFAQVGRTEHNQSPQADEVSFASTADISQISRPVDGSNGSQTRRDDDIKALEDQVYQL